MASSTLVACRHAYEDGEATHGGCFINLETTVDRCAEGNFDRTLLFTDGRSRRSALSQLQVALPGGDATTKVLGILSMDNSLGMLVPSAINLSHRLQGALRCLVDALSILIINNNHQGLLFHLFGSRGHVGKELGKACSSPRTKLVAPVPPLEICPRDLTHRTLA